MRESVAPSRVQVPNEMSVLEHKPYWWLPVTKAIVPVLLLCAVGLLPKSVANAYSADCDRRFRPDVTGDSGRVDAV